MERAPAKLPNTSSRLVSMAVSLVGDADTVRKEIGCSEADFLAYCDGKKEPLWPEFDRLVQIIVREQTRLIKSNRELVASIRAKTSRSGRAL